LSLGSALHAERESKVKKRKASGGIMNEMNKTKVGWKQKIISEMIEYWLNVVYLVFFFSLFTWYRRLILAQYQISYMSYGVSIIEALVLAKVILIGNVLRLDRGLEDKPLIVPTLYKSAVFSLFVGLFSVLEQMTVSWLRGKGLAEGFEELMNKGKYELLARCLVVFCAFIPFFAFKELGRVMGKGKLQKLFFPVFRKKLENL